MKRSLNAQRCAYSLLCESFRSFFHQDPCFDYVDSLQRFTKFFDRWQMLRKFRSDKPEGGMNSLTLNGALHHPTQVTSMFLK